jgi:hypothetical protein
MVHIFSKAVHACVLGGRFGTSGTKFTILLLQLPNIQEEVTEIGCTHALLERQCIETLASTSPPAFLQNHLAPVSCRSIPATTLLLASLLVLRPALSLLVLRPTLSLVLRPALSLLVFVSF